MPAEQNEPTSRVVLVLESLGLLVLGFAVMSFLYQTSVVGPDGEIGVPGHDSFYHTKMAVLLPQIGLVETFPWLKFAYFRQQGDAFVSHHYGFHAVLVPFVHAAKWLTGDYLAGGRWAICTFFGLNLLLFNLLLRAGQVRYRWLWIALFLLLPHQFYARHAFVRAIGISLVMMQLLILMLVRRRYAWAGIVTAAYVHVYLGAVLYVPVVVMLFALAEAVGTDEDRRWPWKLAACTAGGWLVGVLTYPYSAGMLEFLKLQVVGTGLSPDIEVGREWLPYTDPWWFARMSAIVLLAWVVALALRLRFGPRLDSREMALVLIQFAYLVLTLKARRFIEYWPPLCLLSAAYLVAPVLAALARRWSVLRAGWRSPLRRAVPWMTVAAVVALAVVAWTFAMCRPAADVFLLEWRAWAPVLPLLVLVPLCEIWLRRDERDTGRVPYGRLLAIPASGAGLVILLVAVAYLGGSAASAEPRLVPPAWMWTILAGIYTCTPPLFYLARGRTSPLDLAVAARRSVGVVVGTLVLSGVVVAVGSSAFRTAALDTRCMYDLGALRDMMTWLEQHSQPGDVLFTDDWDIFPVYFYHNSHNHYIVGLDPKFTHERRPDLWERYVRISRGEIPTTSHVRLAATDGGSRGEKLDIQLDDIRTHFGAHFVICDRDHRGLASKLARAAQLAELVYPGRDYETCRDAPYLVFRIRDEHEPPIVATPPAPNENGHLYLSQLEPLAVDQGWGHLVNDATVEHRRQTLGGQAFELGLGTHAPSKLLYEIPPGFETFEAVVGIDDETNGLGSIVAAVYLDGNPVFESPVLRGDEESATVRIDVRGARQILLQADATDDGNRFDHVNWSSARFVQPASARVAAAMQRALERARQEDEP